MIRYDMGHPMVRRYRATVQRHACRTEHEHITHTAASTNTDTGKQTRTHRHQSRNTEGFAARKTRPTPTDPKRPEPAKPPARSQQQRAADANRQATRRREGQGGKEREGTATFRFFVRSVPSGRRRYPGELYGIGQYRVQCPPIHIQHLGVGFFHTYCFLLLASSTTKRNLKEKT